MRARRPIPEQAVLRQLLEYNPKTGALHWRERPLQFFKPTHRWSSVSGMRKWNTRYAGRPALAVVDSEGYMGGKLFHTHHRAHRVIWKLVTGRDPYLIDHVNGDRSDNRWSNLRETDDTGNCRNLALYHNNRSGVSGVRLNKKTQRWVAYIRCGGPPIHLGSFDTLASATAARRQAEATFGFHPNHGTRR